MIRNPIPWPNGAKCAVSITFDMDADSLVHTAHPQRAPDMVAARVYCASAGRQVLERQAMWGTNNDAAAWVDWAGPWRSAGPRR